MSARPQPRPTLYEQLEALPEGLTGEILNGQLYAQPRPGRNRGRTPKAALARKLRQHQEVRLGFLDEVANRNVAFAQYGFTLGNAAIADAQPNDLGGRTQQEAALMEVGVF